MDLYSSEQEQVEAIKKWLKENGTAIVVGLAIGIGGISGWRYWQAHKDGRAEAASALFAQAVAAAKSEQSGKAGQAAKQVLSEYGDTFYADFAALMLAKLAVEEQDLPSARQHLERVTVSGDATLARLARMRLVRIHLAAGKPQQAWAEIEELPSSDHSAALAELRGDVLLAQGKTEEAGKQYLEAHAQAEPHEQQDESGTLALKLANLGLARAPAAPAGEVP